MERHHSPPSSFISTMQQYFFGRPLTMRMRRGFFPAFSLPLLISTGIIKECVPDGFSYLSPFRTMIGNPSVPPFFPLPGSVSPPLPHRKKRRGSARRDGPSPPSLPPRFYTSSSPFALSTDWKKRFFSKEPKSTFFSPPPLFLSRTLIPPVQG